MRYWVERKDHLSLTVCNTAPNALQDTLSHCCKGTLLARVQLGFLRIPSTFSADLLSRWLARNWCCYMWLFLPRCRTLHLPLLNFMRLLLAYFSGLYNSLLAYQPILQALCPLQTCCKLCPVGKVLNRIGQSINPWSTPLITGLQLDFDPLTTTLWGPVIQPDFNPPPCLLIQPILLQLLYDKLVGHSVESLTEVKAGNMHCSTGPCQASFSL